MRKSVFPVVFITMIFFLCGAAGMLLVRYHNAEYRADQARLAQLNSDRTICRAYLGIEGDQSHQALMMACGQEVIEAETAKGVRRSQAARTAWRQCWTGAEVCNRALQDAPH